jgi:crotonobetainyl-CoA:carnitine CoA-transferase CaiB-like acyl-CoA transferase
MLPAALEGVRVLDLSHHIAGPFCTKLLGEFGADVIKIERPPAGDPARRVGPFYHDVPHDEGSALFLQLNTNKRSVTLNLKSAEGQRAALRLAERAAIVVENFRPGTLDRLGLGYATLRALNPAVMLVSISNFGQTGPYRDLKLSEITGYAMGGAMQTTGHAEHEPLKLGGNVVQCHAGATAAFAAVAALLRAEDDGAGDHIDASIYESQAGSRDRRTVGLSAYAYTGMTGVRPGNSRRLGVGVRPTADGWINLAGYGPRLPELLKLIGRDDLLDDPRTRNPRFHTDPDFVDEVETSYLAWSTSRSKTQALAEAQSHHVLGAPVNTIADLFSDPHFVERAPWDEIEHPHTGPLAYPGRPLIMGESARPAPRRAPLLGEHTAEVLCDELGYARADLPRLREQGVI